MSLVKRCQGVRIEPLVLVVRPGLDGFVIDSDLFVGISDGDVERKVVLESIVGSETELGERGIRDVKLDCINGAEDEPKDKDSKAKDHNDGDYETEKKPKKAATRATAAATARPVVGLAWWWD